MSRSKEMGERSEADERPDSGRPRPIARERDPEATGQATGLPPIEQQLDRMAVRLRPVQAVLPPEPPSPFIALGDQDFLVRPQGAVVTRSVVSWRAFVGFQIHLFGSPAADLGDLERQRRAVEYLLSLPAQESWAVQLRVLARPAAAPSSPTADEERPAQSVSRLSLGLVGAASGRTEDEALRHVRDLALAILFANGYLTPLYDLQPIADLGELGTLLSPFAMDDLVEVGPRRETVRTLEGQLVVPAPLDPPAGSGQLLCQALVAEAALLGHPLAWIVTLEGADDVGLARILLEQKLAEVQGVYQQDLERASRSGDGQVAILEHARRAGEVGQTLMHLLGMLDGLVGRVQAFLVAEGASVPAPTLAAAVAQLSETSHTPATAATWLRAARPRERAEALRAIEEAHCLAWDQLPGLGNSARAAAIAEGDQSSLSLSLASVAEASKSLLLHLAGARQCAALFQLPIPGPVGLPGLAVRPTAREIWLPHSPAATPTSILLGENAVRDVRQPIWLSVDDRRRHVYCIGQTGTGKTTLLLNCIVQDLLAGMGVAVLDPHGDLIDKVLALMPEERARDVVLFDPSDRERPVGFNFLECADDDERYQVAESFIGMLYQLFDPAHTGIIGPRFEHAARNAMLTAMQAGDLTLVEVVRILTDPHFVQSLLPKVQDPLVRRYWTDQIAQTSDFHRSEVLDYIVSKFSPFVNNRLVRNIVGQSRSTFSLREIMDEGKVLLVNLAQGHLGQKLSTFLGMVLVPRILFTAFSRVGVPEAERRDFCLYVDEFQHYATPAFVDIVSGARKYRLNITMAHQHIGQLPSSVRSAIFGNVGTLIAYRVGLEDAVFLTDAMQPSGFTTADFLELPNFRGIAQVLSQGRRSPCFTMATAPSPDTSSRERQDWTALVRSCARDQHGRPRAQVEEEIARRALL